MTSTAALFLLALHTATPPDTAAADSARAVLLSRDSATRVVLTDRGLDFAFTERGGRRVRRAADSAAAARPARAARASWFDAAALTRSITEGITRDMHLAFPLADVAEVRTERDVLTVCFVARDPDTPPCAKGRRFEFTGASPADVGRFAAAIERARGLAPRVPPAR